MAPSRRLSNGRSPLVNKQSQITAFFTPGKSTVSPSAPPVKQTPKSTPPNPKSVPRNPKSSDSKKPLLVIGPHDHQSPSTPTSNLTSIKTPESGKKPYGESVVRKRIRVYWPIDKQWYDGVVKSFDSLSGKHLIQYDDSEEEELDLENEMFEWVEENTKFRRLKRNLASENVVLDVVEKEEVKSRSGRLRRGSKMVVVEDDDSADEDWGKNVEKEIIDDEMEELDLVEEEEVNEEVESKSKRGCNSEPRKRKKVETEKLGSDKKCKTEGNIGKAVSKISQNVNGSGLFGLAVNLDIEHFIPNTDNALTGDIAERFGNREVEKFRFLGNDRRDAKRRRPGDVDYDPNTLYLPPDFVNNLTGGQRQWWEFKAKHMDKVLFFKMGKFYELYEMDAHVGTKELDLQYMKGEQPHCGFPEKNFTVNAEKLARKGYRVLVVEQTETPDQLELRRKKGSKDKVVKREICAVVTKGTLTEGEMLTINPDASYMISITEGFMASENQIDLLVIGVCIVDVSTSRFMLGQFADDSERNSLCSLLSELRPVEIIKPSKLLSSESEKVLLTHTRSPLVNELVPLLEFWSAEKTVAEVRSIYRRHKNQLVTLRTSIDDSDTNIEDDGSNDLPDVLSELVNDGERGSYAVSAFGGCLSYLRKAFLDQSLLKCAKFELLPCSRFRDIPQKPYMILDAAAIENLELFENTRDGSSTGTLYGQLNQCVTSFGKRMLKNWLVRPLYLAESIRERQDAVASLRVTVKVTEIEIGERGERMSGFHAASLVQGSSSRRRESELGNDDQQGELDTRRTMEVARSWVDAVRGEKEVLQGRNKDSEEDWQLVSRRKSKRSRVGFSTNEVKIECEYKSFVFSVKSNNIHIQEITRNTRDLIQFSICYEAAAWLKNIMKKESKKEFYGKWTWDSRWGDDYLLLIRGENKFGEYFRLTIYSKNSKHLTFFPAEKGYNRWKRFVFGLDKVLLGDFGSISDDGKRTEISKEITVTPKKSITNNDDWNQAIIIETSKATVSWSRIGQEIARRFAIQSTFDIFPFEESKAFFFASVEDKDLMLSIGLWNYEGMSIKLYPWWSSANAVSFSEEGGDEGSWMEVYGVPFNLWSNECFIQIGSKFGGLLDIHNSTIKWEDASAARLKVKHYDQVVSTFMFKFGDFFFPVQVKPLKMINGILDQSYQRIRIPSSTTGAQATVPVNAEKTAQETTFLIEWPKISKPMQVYRRKSSKERSTRKDKGKSVESNSNLNSNLNLNSSSKKGIKQTRYSDPGASSNSGHTTDLVSPVNTDMERSAGQKESVLGLDSSATSNTSPSAAFPNSTFEITTEEDVDFMLKEAESLAYLQKSNSSLDGNLNGNLEGSGRLGMEQYSSSSQIDLSSSTEKWSTLKHKIDQKLRVEFESVLSQMVAIGPKLGLAFVGSEEENNDIMVDSMKTHLSNLEREKSTRV